MQSFTAKMWSAGALAASATMGATAQAAETPVPSVETIFPGDFDRALNLMMMGEGGEAGIGINRTWPTISTPALTDAQITKSVSSNSLAIPHHYTLQFSPDGKVAGYHLSYKQIDASACPKPEVVGDNFLFHDGVCNSRTPVPWTGTWSTNNHRLCMDLAWQGGTLKDCYHMFFMLNSVALVQPNGIVWNKAHTLKRGATADE